MEHITIITLAAILSLVAIAALKGKSIIALLSPVFAKFSKEEKKEPPEPVEDKKNPKKEPITLSPTILKGYVLNSDGTAAQSFNICDNNIYDEHGNNVGFTISRPSETVGIKEGEHRLFLDAPRDKKGNFNFNDPATRRSFTVHTDAVTIGQDENGFYGTVSNPKVKSIYVVNNKNEPKIKVKYGDTFDVNHGTYILVGSQWIYFEIPDDVSFVEFNLGSSATEGSDTNDMPFFKGSSEAVSQNKGMISRNKSSNLSDISGMHFSSLPKNSEPATKASGGKHFPYD